MVASSVIARGMSLADLQNSQFITYQDQQNSIFEAYKDLYSEITKNDDDYFISTLALTSSQATSPSPGEFLFSLPTDFYKIRTVEYQVGSYYIPMERFSLADRGFPSGKPSYRFQGNNLWVKGWNYAGTGGVFNLRVHYYPPPVQPTFPDVPLLYGKAVTSANLNAVTSPAWANIQLYNGNAMVSNRIFFYVQTNTSICAENIDTQISATLATAAGTATNLVYYKGNLYYLQGGQIFAGVYTPDATAVTFAALNFTGGIPNTPNSTITGFTIYQNTIYMTTSTASFFTVSGGLTGGAITLISSGSTLNFYTPVFGGVTAYLSAGALFVNGASLGGSYTAMTNDTSGYIFVLDGSHNLYCLTISPTLHTVTATVLIQSDVASIGPWNQGQGPLPYQGGTSQIPMTGFEQLRFIALSAVPDTDFAYPINSNECGEIMAFQCAIDFKAKQDQSHDQLTARKAELMARLVENMRRDDYKMERVSNVYAARENSGIGLL